MKTNRLLTIFVFFLMAAHTNAQSILPKFFRAFPYYITSPIDGVVYQRGPDNTATIKVNGSYNRSNSNSGFDIAFYANLKSLDLNGNVNNLSDIDIPLTILSNNTNTISFSGEKPIPGGWYQLEVSYKLALTPRFTISKMKIGVGEVFIISGQSNAQGLPNSSNQNDKVANNPQPTLDAVRVQPDQFDVAKYLVATDPTSVGIATNFQVQKPYLSPLISGKEAYNNPSSGIAPLGNSLWYWVALGEKIAQAYNVPVAFFNAAFGGTTIKAWQESIDPNAHPLGAPNAGTYSAGAPYGFFKNALKFYGSTYGVRSVLWLQGETDAKALRDNNWLAQRINSSTEYSQKLTQVINQSRQDLLPNSDLTWMVGKASFIEGVWYDAGTQDAQSAITVRQGQEQVISSGLVKRGPDIDQIKERASGPGEPTHLAGAGLWKAAQAWFDAFQSTNLLSSNPIRPQSLGTEPRSVQLDANGTITTALPAGSRYIWYNGNGGHINLNTPAGYGPTIPNDITDPLVLIEDNNGNSTLAGLILPNLDATSTCSVSSPAATFDEANCTSVRGWAFDQANLNQPVTIDIYVDGVKTYAGITADGDRPDLAAYFNNPAARYHGFTYSFPADAPWKNGQNHSISVRICGTNNDIAGGPKTVNSCSGGSNPPPTGGGSCSVSNPAATFDDADCNSIRGWAFDQANLNQPVLIDIYVDGVKTYAGITADADRPDLATYFNNPAARYHGFMYSFPANASWKNGQNHSISVRICGTNNDIAGGPKTINSCTGGSNPPTGGGLAFQIVSYDCNTGVLQYKFTGGNGAAIDVSLPGIFGGTMNANTVASYTFPGDGRTNRTVTGTASQAGTQISINFTNGCNMSIGGRIGYNASEGLLQENDLNLVTYPNPNEGHFLVNFSVLQGDSYTIQVTDLLGHALLKRESISKTTQITEQIDLSHLKQTSVIVQVKSGKKTASKIVVMHR